MTEKKVKTNSRTQDFSAKIKVNGETYLIDSEDLGIQNPHIIMRIYREGEIIYSRKINYKDILNRPDFNERLSDLLMRQQQIGIETLKKEKAVPGRMHKKIDIKENTIIRKRSYKDYVNRIEALVRTNSKIEALELLTEAMEHYPRNPIVSSYHGYVEALVHRQYAEGIKICKQSFKILRAQTSLGVGFFLPILYLNLGRAYLIANKRKEAYYSFQKGLENDKKNEDILRELRELGLRRKPCFPFLKRSNPLNKYVGMLTYELQKKRRAIN